MGEFLGFFWLAGAVVASVLASSRGRSALLYFALGIFISPLLAIVLVLGLPPEKPSTTTHRVCPACREYVVKSASKCKHCTSEMPVLEI